MISKRILFPFVGDTVGGSHISAVTLVRGLQTGEYDPQVLVHAPGPLEQYLARADVPWTSLPLPFLGASGWSILASIAAATIPRARYLKAQAISIVHTNDARMHCAWLPAARLAGVKHVWHQRTVPNVALFRAISRYSDKLVAISKASAPPGSRVAIIPNPITSRLDLPSKLQCRESVLRAVGAPPDAHLVCWVANWIEKKRPIRLVNVANEVLRRTRKPVIFLMIGEPRPSTERAVRELVETLGIDDNVKFMGTKWPIEPWISGCDLMVSTAVDEAFGRTLVEAMLVETPVVATAAAGHLEVIDSGRTGWLVPPDDIGAFAEAVTKVLEHPEQAKVMAATARGEALVAYSIENHVRAIEGIYDDLLSKPR